MARIDGGEMLVRVLVQHGVREVFTLHGGHLDAIYQAAGDRLRFIDTRHEQAAGHAADGWARTTGRLGVAIVTAGPGVTDVVTAVANAYLDAVPTLFLGGAAPLRDAETLPLQGGLDQVAMLRPITKWAVRITHTRRLPDLLAQAIRVATTGRPGPVFVEIPIDVLFAREDEAKAVFPAPLTPTRPAPPDAAVQGAIAALAAAERPLILAGGGVWFSAAADALRAFAERTGIPVATNGKAHGTLPPEHPACAGSVATIAALARTGTPPDTVLVLGARLGLFTGGRAAFSPPPATSSRSTSSPRRSVATITSISPSAPTAAKPSWLSMPPRAPRPGPTAPVGRPPCTLRADSCGACSPERWKRRPRRSIRTGWRTRWPRRPGPTPS